MTAHRRLAHSLEAEARPLRQAEPFIVDQRREGWRLVVEFLAAFLVFFVPIALVILGAVSR